MVTKMYSISFAIPEYKTQFYVCLFAVINIEQLTDLVFGGQKNCMSCQLPTYNQIRNTQNSQIVLSASLLLGLSKAHAFLHEEGESLP